jgi:hypothetical protein
MAKKNKYKNRRLELSSKFMEMGRALLIEGEEKKDYVISQTGAFFILLSSIMGSEEDVLMFSEICSMFSAKKVLENMHKNNIPLNGMDIRDDKNFEDFIKRVNKSRRDSGLDPID